ncbi:uncharacterized protein OGAPODRAFT_16812 [Ogataea polymorpha]|uniref:uncharacterized protein n=1 Tax=Ogataea polymorpha TaxID=460523 RepID=UPI0007F4A74D|nr:uncharacterized protein OGAPODRAFT_16812 [Ogataea polymorpha]KAG7939341.1 hypothetical protein KL934_000275 [Ogataea polymorpha]OBA14878.1 hypothetical protein OGAPODRAFT_16812 [Ogataea polymorpha]
MASFSNFMEQFTFAPEFAPRQEKLVDTDPFYDVLSSKLGYLRDQVNQNSSPHSSVSSASRDSIFSNPSAFTLPVELQGGVSNISSRRPSYTAELYYTNHNKLDLPPVFVQAPPYAASSRFFDVDHTRTHSVDYPASFLPPLNSFLSQVQPQDSLVTLDNGLLLEKVSNSIVTSAELKAEFLKDAKYFGDFDVSMKIVHQLNVLLGTSLTETPGILQIRVGKLLDYLLTQNEDLAGSPQKVPKSYSMIINKNGKLDIISLPKTSNLKLTPKDLIIIEGDRGKDLVMVLQPQIDFRFALLFNYLKKKLHLKSLEFGNANSSQAPSNNKPQNNQNNQNNQHNANTQRSIINEDENFITLPNKQILRFAKPHELTQLTSKYNDELTAYRICLNYVQSLNLDLIIKNVEFQFDKKKLIIYYYCLRRLDFRGLIKELFKIYKTRIWLCAVLPIEKSFKPLLTYEMEKKYHGSSPLASSSSRSNDLTIVDPLPASESINSLDEIEEPVCFHSKVFLSLIEWFKFEMLDQETFNEKFPFLT